MPTNSNTGDYSYTTTATTSSTPYNPFPQYTFDWTEIPEINGNQTYTVVGQAGWTRDTAREYAREHIMRMNGLGQRPESVLERHTFKLNKSLENYYVG